ncbi:hypothetical protein EV359DRAFT_66577 [Lentinula novae-zelandiae]|nr:hypothetical protein EV359DRAFT_66577 [Lentinula novae-zelandiae]
MVHSRTVYGTLFAIAGSASSVLAVPISSSSSSSAGSTSSTLAAIATTTTSSIGIAPASTSGLVVPSGSVPNSRRSEAVGVFVDNVNKFEDGEEDEEIENKLDLTFIPVPVHIPVPTHEEDHVMDVITQHSGLGGSSTEFGKEDITLGINIEARTPIEEDEEPLIPKTHSIPGGAASEQTTSFKQKVGAGLKKSVNNMLGGFTAGHNTPGAPPNPGDSLSSNKVVDDGKKN